MHIQMALIPTNAEYTKEQRELIEKLKIDL
jgi:hypothetical protein